MKSNTTAIWFTLAVALAAGIWFAEKQFKPAALNDDKLLSGLRATEVTSFQIIPAGVREISVSRTNKNWFLDKPLAYPAQAAAIETLLAGLEKLSPALRLTAAEMQSHKNVDAEFGFENPQFRLDLAAGGASWHLLIGNQTAPGDGVYVRLVGSAAVFVIDVRVLQFFPRDANAWRDSALVDAAGSVDWLVITNGAKAIELRRDATNHVWRMIRPQPARADSEFINSALQQLRTTKVMRFVTDDPKADLTSYGLQPAALEVWLGRGTNFSAALHAGKEVVENPGQLFARRDGWNSVVTVSKESLLPWRGEVNDFREPHLLDLTTPPTVIEMRGENSFTLQQRGSNDWQVVGETFPVDTENVQQYIRLLTSLQIAEFVKDVVTGSGFQSFGLATNTHSITLRGSAGDTNAILGQIVFGATETNKVFVKRGDEESVYALALADANRLPEHGWEFRDRRLWNFSVTNLAQITLHQAGKTRQILRTGFNKWKLAEGSQGMVDSIGLEETAKQFGTLTAAGWIGRDFSAPEKYGFNTNNLAISFEMKTGEKFGVEFGAELPSQTALAAATLAGERWAFVFPPMIFQLVTAYLTIPPGTP